MDIYRKHIESSPRSRESGWAGDEPKEARSMTRNALSAKLLRLGLAILTLATLTVAPILASCPPG